ncbi:MAG TPA: ATP-binding protein [Blastocatellia bacterium]|nr:ATP-binding protein [Blastocatellia bacterium]
MPNLATLLIVDSRLLGAIVLCAAVVALGIFVMAHNPRITVNRRFGVMALTTAGWILTISAALAAKDPGHTVILGRIGFAFASGIPFSLVWMVDSVSSSQRRTRVIRVLLPGVLCLGFVLASLSPLIVASATSGTPRANFVYGPIHRFFGIYFLFCFLSGLYTLWRTIKSASGIDRLQLRYLLLGISLTGIGAMTTNLVIPVIWGTSRYSALGPYFSLLFFSFSAHAIIRYRLMDIRVVIRQGVVYFCAIVISASFFLAFADILRRLAGYDRDRVPLVEALVIAILLAIFFQPLKHRIQRSLNRYVYRETYDYQRTVREASRRLSTMLDLEPLLDYLGSVIETTFKVEAVTVYLRHPSLKAFAPRHANPVGQHRTSPVPGLPETSPLVTLLESDQRTLVREEATRDSSDARRVVAGQALERLGGDLAFPLMDDRAIAGIIIVGPKRSGDPYFAEDIDLLETLIGQAAVAMKNAQLYRQVVLINEYVDNILSTMESGVIAVNPLGEISLFNPAAERLTGLRTSDVRTKPYQSLPMPLASPLRDALEARTPRSQFELSIQGPEGVSVPLVCSTAILRHRAGATHGALIVFSDLTRLKALETEKRRAERLASFGALASGVAHEIKNPLVAIRTFAELLPERFTDTDFREDFAKVVIREIARIDDLVGRLRGIAATAPQQIGTIDVREPITDTLALLRAQLEQTRTTVHCDFNDPAPFISVEEAQLKQLFLNLFLNAIEAMGSGGELLVHLSRREIQDGQWIVVEVSDTGPGIPESVRSNIFDPFFTTKPRGSGLGLAICRGITDAHRGAIRAENRFDRSGATMVVEFPAAVDTLLLAEEKVLRD